MTRLRDVTTNSLLLAAGLGVAVGLAEVVLHAMNPGASFGAAQELPWMRGADRGELFTIDSEFGFRPRLDSEVFSVYGTHRNEYPLSKTPDRERLLFVGDSVTARGRIIEALRELYGDAAAEYWNAGVESFNTVQEVAFYQKYNAAIEPDHVIVTFHLNDYETTPIAFRDDSGRLVVYALNQPAQQVQPWLFQHSYLYRLWLGQMRRDGEDFRAVVRETESALLELRDELAARDARFSVIVLPLLQRPQKWREQHVGARKRILAFLETEGIVHFDLFPVLEQAYADGIKVQEASGDTWHPNAAIAERFAVYLRDAGLL